MPSEPRISFTSLSMFDICPQFVINISFMIVYIIDYNSINTNNPAAVVVN